MHLATLRPDENPEDAAELGLTAGGTAGMSAVDTAETQEQTTPVEVVTSTLRDKLQQFLAFGEPDRDLRLLLDRELELPQLQQRHGDPLLDRRDRAPGARHDVRDHHRRHRPVDRHGDGAVRGHLRRPDHEERAAPRSSGVIGAVLFGGLIGLVNGFNVSILGIPPFIATLAMMLVCQGLALVISDSTPIYFTRLAELHARSRRATCSGSNFPNAVLVLALAFAIAAVLLNKTMLGRYTYSIGSNEEATALSGISVRRWKIVIYTLAGLFTGLAGVMISARLASAQPGTGMGYELQAIAAVVIGGTSLAGGKGSIVGTVIGALIISVLNNGLQIMSIPQEWQNVILGLVILVAVYADMARKRTSTT